MIFYLSEAAAMYAHVNPSVAVCGGINSLMAAINNGHHLLIAESYNAYKTLSDIACLGDHEKAFFKSRATNWFTFPDLADIGFSLLAEIEAPEEDVDYPFTNDLKVMVTFELLSRMTLCAPSLLLSENISDSRFYGCLLNWYMEGWGLEAFHAKYELRHGGGGTTAALYEMIQTEKQKFCACILDSDKSSPGGKAGGTLKNVLRVHDDTCIISRPIYDYSFHEKENLIDYVAVEGILKGVLDENQTKELNNFLDVYRTLPYKYQSHLDLKKGITCAVLSSMKCNDINSFKYWEEYLRDHTDLEDSPCNLCLDSECEAVFIPKAPSFVREEALKINFSELAESANSDLRSIWQKLGESLAPVFIAEQESFIK
tara:strand:- start:171 stop:1283 length:1113 start_codon:yes stop_codon:yes gene_type:complete